MKGRDKTPFSGPPGIGSRSFCDCQEAVAHRSLSEPTEELNSNGERAGESGRERGSPLSGFDFVGEISFYGLKAPAWPFLKPRYQIFYCLFSSSDSPPPFPLGSAPFFSAPVYPSLSFLLQLSSHLQIVLDDLLTAKPLLFHIILLKRKCVT